MDSRQQLRKRMREQRRALSAHERERYSIQLASRLAKSHVFRNSQHIAFYIANDGEIDLTPLMRVAWSMKKHCYLPILSPAFQRHLYFAEYNDGDVLKHNQFGIPEPAVSPRKWRKGSRLGLVLTPLVAFDENGNRLGMGGGYYDKTFAYLRHQTRWRRPRLIGVAYDFQRVRSLEFASWDVPLNGVVTPQTFFSL